MDNKQLRANLEEIASAISHYPDSVTDSAEYFDRGDDTLLLDLGFIYSDSTLMRGEVQGVTWYVDLEAKRAPIWSFMVHGVHTTPVRYGRMEYTQAIYRLDDLSLTLAGRYKKNAN